MPTVLFVSDPHRPIETCALVSIVADAIAQGWRVVLASSDVISIRRYCCQLPVTVVPVPSEVVRSAQGDHSALTYWQELFAELRPALGVFVDSLGALVAARGASFRKVLIGCRSLGTSEAREAVMADAPAIRLATLPDLCSVEANDATFLGANLDVDGAPPRWPDLNAARVFALLEPHRRTPTVCDLLSRIGQSTCAAVLECHPSVRRLASNTLHIEPDPVALRTAAEQCEVAVLHGDPVETAYFLQYGKPLFLLPTTALQVATARRVAELGAGVVADIERPMSMAKAWLALQSDEGCRSSARALAKRHSDKPRSLQDLFSGKG